MSELNLPWWTRFGRTGTDGLTNAERRHIARNSPIAQGPSPESRYLMAKWRAEKGYTDE